MNAAVALGILFAVDGTAGLIWPRQYLRLFKVGPAGLKELFEGLAERPDLARALCVAEIAAGLVLIRRDA